SSTGLVELWEDGPLLKDMNAHIVSVTKLH
ncbi:hypothetical protein A2U01_0111468, partial [Trifolium medium]|nr:hypothetical protein [Trifolium medium]